MTYANFIRTKDGHLLAASDPDPEWFIDGLCTGDSVQDVIENHQKERPDCREVSPQFWRILAQRIWDMLEANGRYDQETFDALVQQGVRAQRWKTKRWKRRAKAYRAALEAAGVPIPDVEDPRPPKQPTGMMARVEIDSRHLLDEESHEEHVLQPDHPADPAPIQNGHQEARVALPPPGPPAQRLREGDGAEEGGEDPEAGED